MGQLLIVRALPAVVYKDPDEVRDFPVDWAADIPAGATITASVFLPAVGIVKDSDGFTDSATVVRFSGGAVGRYAVTNRVTLSDGQILDFPFTVVVRDR